MTEAWFQAAFGAHYPLLYAHRDAVEARRCLDLLPTLAPMDGPILDLGCGDGRHLDHLGRRGISAMGLDLSPHLLEVARERAQREESLILVRGDMRRIPFSDEGFGSVLSLFTAFGYFGSPASNLGPLQEISRVLKLGGHWFLDYFDGDRVRAELGDGQPRERFREMGPLRVSEVRRLVLEDALVTKEVSLNPRAGYEPEAAALEVPPEGRTYTERVAVFTLEEFDTLAGRAGLKRVAAAGGYEGQALGTGTRWILVYEKVSEDR